jgi:gamma-D-glutamyl-L-lysine dipeptidyl-peptidase
LAALVVLGTAAVLAGAGATPASVSARPPARWVRVSVATLWVRPGEARTVDAPAGAYPADPRAWVAGLSVTQKRWLVGRLETQALYGGKVYLLGASGSWSHVAVAGQPTPRNTWGYPGWLPTRQLTATAPVAGAQTAGGVQTAVVRRPTVWLYDSAALEGRVLELSYGTRLPVVSSDSGAVEISRPEGGTGWLRRAAVALHTDGAAWPALSGARLVAEARRFLGLKYLWAGTAGFGYDCSGLTHSVFRALGTSIPRDADDQMRVGRRVATRGALRAGDLVFFRNASGLIHHVGMCVGDGKMIHAPSTGSAVTVVSLAAQPYATEFAGGRRLTP